MSRVRIAMRTTLVMICTGLGVAPARAQDHPPQQEPAHEVHQEDGEEHFHRNAVGLIVGGTYESKDDDTFFTLGVEYERLFNPSFAVLLGIEYISEVDAVVLAVPLVYRHRSGFRLLAGPGIELESRRPAFGEEPGELAEALEDRLAPREENLFLLRFGALYNFEIGERYTIAPTVNLDLVREDGRWVEAVVFVVSFGFDF